MGARAVLLFAFLLAVGCRFHVDALTQQENDLLAIPRAAAAKTYDQETMHESVSVDFNMEGMFPLFGQLAIGAKMTEDRVQRRNADGSHDVYAKTTTFATMGGFPISSYSMDEVVLDGVAWARLVEGAYDVEVPDGWFKPADQGLDDLEKEVSDQLTQATGVEVKEALLDENVESIEETADSTEETQCFKVTPSKAFKAKLLSSEIDDDSDALNEKAVVHQIFCVTGGFLVELGMDMKAEGYDTEKATGINSSGKASNVYSEFNEPVEIPDPNIPY